MISGEHTSHHPGLSSVVVFAAAIILGLTYVFLVPPWQHYDEPGHFEYAWLAANRPGWPKPGDYDQSMRLEVAASMIEHGFFRGLGGISNLLSINKPIDIGISQLGDVPLYYFLASLPLRLFRFTDITFQLYSARLVSFALFLLTIAGSMQTSRILFPEGHALRWMIPLFLACLPGLVDLMTAANNDVAAIAFCTWFFAASADLVKNGANPKRILFLSLTIGLSVFSKSTAWFTVPLGVLAVFLGIYRARQTAIVWGVALLSSIIIFAVTFSWSETSPALFSYQDPASFPARMKSQNAPVGEYVAARQQISKSTSSFYQNLSSEALRDLSGQEVTLGGWAWADHPAPMDFPTLTIDNQEIAFTKTIELSQNPTFYSFQARLPDKASSGWIEYKPFAGSDDNRLYYDGWVLVKGAFSTDNFPQFTDSGAASGEWNGASFTNILRNASFESGWPVISPLALKVVEKLPFRLFSYPFILLDLRGTLWYYSAASQQIIRTFWGQFGWAHVPLLGDKPYRIFVFLFILSGVGLFASAITDRKKIPWPLILFGSLAILFELIVVLQRGAGSWFNRTLLPASRYIFPSIYPIAAILSWGWYQIYRRVPRRISLVKPILLGIFLASCISVNVWAFTTLWKYYY